MIRLYDTARREVVPLAQRDPGRVSVYLCGPTVYSAPHIGHGRQLLVYDALCRYLRWQGLDVTFVSNITDIDDNIINRGLAEDRDPAEIAVRCEEVWWSAADALGVARPDHVPHATDYVEAMVELVAALIDEGAAYVTPDGVYLAVETVADYGLLAHQSLADLQEGAGERDLVGTDKRHPADFVLWKLAKAGEPSWPSPWGPGRPGWHTECVVMSLGLLGEGFDLHAGGLDLRFPHHENERAQAVAHGKTFAQHWMHHGFVELEGEKMSKSLGNVRNLLDLIEAYDPRAYRLLVLRSHYRSPMEVTDDSMVDASAAVERLDAFARRTGELVTDARDGADGRGDDGSGKPDGAVLDAFRLALDDDFDTPAGVDLLFRQVREANTALDEGDRPRARMAALTAWELAGVLGLELAAGADDVPAGIGALVAERQDARSAKDFARADELRDELAAAGWTVEDSADGPVVRPRRG
ncbi:MAG: cysteine--tRNA ligase [Acidimicrobiales bacterium]